MNYLDFSLFQVYPYLALGIFAIGCWARFDYASYTWRSGSSQLLSGKWMRIGSNWFHIGILVVLGGHLVGLLTPSWLYEIVISPHQKQLLAMTVGGLGGLLCLAGMTILLVIEARSVGLLAGQWVALILATVLVAGACIWIVSWEDKDEPEDADAVEAAKDEPAA